MTIPRYITHVKINGPTGLQEFKILGNINLAIRKLKPSSPIPSWFWNRLKSNRGKETTYTSPDGSNVSFTLEQHVIDAERKNQGGPKNG